MGLEKLYKPKIGKRIYFYFAGEVYECEVGYLGTDSFIIEDYDSRWDVEWFYEDYNEKWFTSLAKCKKACKAEYGEPVDVFLLDD